MTEKESKVVIGNTDKTAKDEVPEEFIDREFEVPTEQVELPSKGIFYPNKQQAVEVKYLTANEDNILFSPELLRSGKVLDALLQVAIIDPTLRPDDMLIGDRNAVLLHLRKTGLGNIYQPGSMTCPSCDEEFSPDVDLDKLQLKFPDTEPDENLEYDFDLPVMKIPIKFRLLNGKDENYLSKFSTTGTKGKKSTYKVSRIITERYKIQIMAVKGNRDKIYIGKLVEAMPMKDSIAFREYVRLISPGVDFNYAFTCDNCGHVFDADVPLNYRLFYPDAEL